MIGTEIDAVRAVVVEYLEGMIWGQAERVERVFHPRAIQVGHYAGDLEFLSREGFVDWVRSATTQAAGTPYVAELISVDVTGNVAVAKVSDTCFGSDFVDWLVLIKDGGQWQIVTKAFHVAAGEGAA